eukprot:TRINITY_DN23118_c0_g1_i3.p2 TRINITY_DN23118_c0_g1~~TRINITY_DN23118_c0_g1_i3.p2  ORF type:complete len:909 (+),score=350.70 TRINITY_DN23118_c0_g1_i3:697-3423(+)
MLAAYYALISVYTSEHAAVVLGPGGLQRPGTRSGRSLDDPYWRQFHGVSVVFTWVNGSDPLFQKQRREHGNRGGESRYRETEELMHSLRCWERFVPWHTGDLILVTPNGVAPSWLNMSVPRVRVVDQYALIPKGSQPAFNSAVVEQVLHLIPGLTELFIHMNDDYMIGRMVHPSDFFTDDGGVRLYLESNVVSGGTAQYETLKARRSKQWLASVYHTIGVVDSKIPRTRPRYFVKHAPFVYSRKAFEMMHKIWPAELEAASHMRFRNYDDVLVPFMHHVLMTEKAPRARRVRTGETLVPQGDQALPPVDWHVGNSDDLDAILCIVKDNVYSAFQKMHDHLQHPRMFFTVNDGFKRDESSEVLRSFLQRIQPFQSSFELQREGRWLPEAPRYVPRPDVAQWSTQYNTLHTRAVQAAMDRREGHLNNDLPSDESYAKPDAVMVALEQERQQLIRLWQRGTYVYERLAQRDSANDTGMASFACSGSATVGLNCKHSLGSSAPQKTYNLVPDCEAFDVVFTWVNGSDPTLLADTARLANKKIDSDAARIRETGQLRYGLRSVRRYLPWVRHIWVVSGTPKPSWLDASTPYVTYVPHADIFTPEERPQLNSNSIQARLHRIPHLAMRYLSMDDDYLITQPAAPEDLLGDHLMHTLQSFRGKFRASRLKNSPYKDAILHTRRMVVNHLQAQRGGEQDGDLSFLDILHSPIVVDRVAMQAVQGVFSDSVHELPTHKFRQGDDHEPYMAYTFFVQGMQDHVKGKPTREIFTEAAKTGHWFSWEQLACRVSGVHPNRWLRGTARLFDSTLGKEGCAVVFGANNSGAAAPREECEGRLLDAAARVALKQSRSEKGDTTFVMLRDDTKFRLLHDKLRKGKARFACLNDDFSPMVSDNVLKQLHDLLGSLFPETAPWEKQ